MAGYVMKMSILVSNINRRGLKDLSSEARHKSICCPLPTIKKTNKMKMIVLNLVLILICNNQIIAQHNYEYALEIATRFLGAQRCGNSDSWLHGDCHLQDGQTVGIDLTGGWHDCGDHIKFGHTAPYTAAFLLFAYLENPQGYPDNYSPQFSEPPANGIPDILDEIKYETDLLIRSIRNDTVYYQIGDSTDHNSFSEPVYQSEYLPVSQGGNPRNVYFITEGASNICGESCAALALMSIAYSDIDQSYSNLCLQKAVEYYQLGKTTPSSIPSTSRDGEYYYPASNWADDMAFGAISLYKATGSNQYLTDAIDFYNNADFYLEDWYVLTDATVNQLVNLALYIETSNNQYKTAYQSHLQEMLWMQTDCGYIHFADWGSLTYAVNEAYLALLFYNLTGNIDALNFGMSNIDFVLGTHSNTDNSIAENFSFLIGYNELNGSFPQYPHHAGAFGYGNNAWDLFSQEEENPGTIPYNYQLTGALVGGPKSECGNYNDNISDAVSNEVCIYYNAGLINSLSLINLMVSVEELTQNQQLKIYPNPATDYVFVENKMLEKIKIYDICGKLMIETNDDKIDISEFTTGLYIIKILNETVKLIKIR